MNDVSLVVSELPDGDEDDISDINPDSILELASDSSSPLDSIDAVGLNPSISEQPEYLCVLSAFLLEDELSLSSLVEILALLSLISSFTCNTELDSVYGNHQFTYLFLLAC